MEEIHGSAIEEHRMEYVLVTADIANVTDHEKRFSPPIQLPVKDETGHSYRFDIAARSRLDDRFDVRPPLAPRELRRGDLPNLVPKGDPPLLDL